MEFGLAAVVPALTAAVDEDIEVDDAREHCEGAIAELLRRGRADASLRDDISVSDVAQLLLRLARPLPGAGAPDVAYELTRRHLAIVLPGFAPAAVAG